MDQDYRKQAIGAVSRPRVYGLVGVVVLVGGLALSGCKSPAEYREKADDVAYDIIESKQQEALGETEPFRIERPSDILRRRLIEEQGLPISSGASLGTDELEPVAHWPDEDYPEASSSPDANIPVEPNRPVRISLVEALAIAARNSPDYQSRKEDVFRTALDLDLERNNFRNIFSAGADSSLTRDTAGPQETTTLVSGGSAGVTRTLKNGLDISSVVALDLLNLLTQGGSSTLGLSSDTSIFLPLLRGAGRFIVTEPLTQAERNVVYEIWDFERFRRTFAVNIAQDYYSVLRQVDALTNAENNYRSAVQSARYARRQADAGRLPQIQVDQAVQRELSGRSGWIAAQEQLKSSLDSFKVTLGLPTDALIALDPNELVALRERAAQYVELMRAATKAEAAEQVPPADAEVELIPPDQAEAGPYEIDEETAIRLALENRLDLKIANDTVQDAQRQVVVAADALRAGLNLTGRAKLEDNDEDGTLRLQEGGVYSVGLALDLPLERTRERNTYRNSLITLERTTRSVQALEDNIKLAVRNELRTLLQSREALKIQAQSVVIAENSVRNATLLLEAGRTQIRDLLEAQDDLLSAQNQLTRAVVDYRIAELQFQRDLDLLRITREGLIQEYPPEEIRHDS